MRSTALIAVAVAATVAVAAFAIAADGDDAIELSGETGVTTTSQAPVAVDAPRLDAVDWADLLGGSDASTPDSTSSVDGDARSQPVGTASAPAPEPTAPDVGGLTSAVPTAPTTSVVASASAGLTTTTSPAAPLPPTTTTGTTTVPGSPTPVSTSPTTTVATTTSVAGAAPTTTTTSTTTTTTTTTTVPPTTEAGLAPFTRTFNSSGGSITVSWNGSSLSLDSVAPDRRHRASVEEASATSIRVRFYGRKDSQISVWVSGDELYVHIS